VDRFAELVDQLASYENNPDPLHFTMRFIDGLREDLRAPVLIQRPTDLDTAYVLAKLQEEVVVPGRRREFKKNDYGFPHKQDVPPSSLLPAPGKLDRTVMASHEASKPRSISDRWSSLKAYRRAQGLCQHCAEKWTKDHKCSDKIQLHVLQEVLEVFEDMESSDIEQNCIGHSPDQLFCSISEAAISGTSASRTMCMAGQIQGVGIKILVDSGSSHTFIRSALAAQLQVANGQNLVCSDYFPHTEWEMAGYSFKSDLRVLPLSSYDMILGLDWLEVHSPMKVHWKDRWISIPYDGATILLCGSAANLPV
jgi:hypothetical protein